MAAGWPACLQVQLYQRVISLFGKGEKLTLGQTIQVQNPYAVVELLEHKGAHWRTKVGWWNTTLLYNPNTSLVVNAKLNPTTLLSQVEQEVTHDCTQIRFILTDLIWKINLFITQVKRWKQFYVKGEKRTGCAVVALWVVREAHPLFNSCSKGRADCLEKALQFGIDKKLTFIQIASMFCMFCMHIEPLKGRGLLTAKCTMIKHAE